MSNETSVKSLREVTSKESKLIIENEKLKNEIQQLRSIKEDIALKSEDTTTVIKMEFLRQAFRCFMETTEPLDRQRHGHVMACLLNFSVEDQQMVREQVAKLNSIANIFGFANPLNIGQNFSKCFESGSKCYTSLATSP